MHLGAFGLSAHTTLRLRLVTTVHETTNTVPFLPLLCNFRSNLLDYTTYKAIR